MTPKKHKSRAVFLLAALSLVACAPTDETTQTDSLRGKALYDARCAHCHGTAGQGAGPASLGLGGPPPSLRFLSRNNGGVFPRDYVMDTIDGLSRHNDLTAAMPEFGASDLGPVIQVEVDGLSTPTPADLIALSNYLESIQDQ